MLDSILNFLQIAYKIARDQFPGKLRETFLVLSDSEPKPSPDLGARSLSLEARPRDPRDRGRKHHRESDSMSVGSSSAKKPDKTRSAEKRK